MIISENMDNKCEVWCEMRTVQETYFEKVGLYVRPAMRNEDQKWETKIYKCEMWKEIRIISEKCDKKLGL